MGDGSKALFQEMGFASSPRAEKKKAVTFR
jgi:hypothetical protein